MSVFYTNPLSPPDAPIITFLTRDQVIPLESESENQQASFRCLAVGEPAPSIRWSHKSVSVNDLSSPENKYTVTTQSEVRGDGSVLVTSELRINTLRVFDSGDVRCEAFNMPETAGESSVISTSSTSELSILGEWVW